MRVSELHSATATVLRALRESQLRDALRDFRGEALKGGAASHIALGSLKQSYQNYIATATTYGESERQICQALHIDEISQLHYWQQQLSNNQSRQSLIANLVSIYSRVMFATSHLPSLLNLTKEVDEQSQRPVPLMTRRIEVDPGQALITLKLVDAGEGASNPDRISRLIDGTEMVYVACAGLTKRAADDLELVRIIGEGDRLISFTGDRESISAMKTVVVSIADAIVDHLDDGEINIDNMVRSLPIIEAIRDLHKVGSLTTKDARQLQEAMINGCSLLTECGAILDEETNGESKSGDGPLANDDYYESYQNARRQLQALEGVAETDQL